ncbi:MAG: sigma-E processing peptidase SpoIIGA [Lachnospiraceae bacterium]|nr:sigma-E processing peptidase SpoIIGA [Lachnospiraceae bacterium]
MKVYLDIFFLVNMGMNFVVLMFAGFFQKRKIRLGRLIAAAAAGAVLSVGLLVFHVHRQLLLLILLYLVGSAGILRIAFGKTTKRAMLWNLLMFYVSAFILAGILLSIQNLPFARGNTFVLLFGAGAVLFFCYRLLPLKRQMEKKTEQYYVVRLYHDGEQICGIGFLDTGNQLREPFSQKPVLIGEKDFFLPVLKGEKEVIFRYIPFHSLGKDTGMIPAFQSDYIEIKGKDGVWHRWDKPWIALYDSYISVDGEYEIILHPDMLMNL